MQSTVKLFRISWPSASIIGPSSLQSQKVAREIEYHEVVLIL